MILISWKFFFEKDVNFLIRLVNKFIIKIKNGFQIWVPRPKIHYMRYNMFKMTKIIFLTLRMTKIDFMYIFFNSSIYSVFLVEELKSEIRFWFWCVFHEISPKKRKMIISEYQALYRQRSKVAQTSISILYYRLWRF